MYLEAITYKLALNFLTDVSVGDANVTSIKVDFYDIASGKREKYNYATLSEMVDEFKATYEGYQLSDRAGALVSIESFLVTYDSLGYTLDISARDVLGDYVLTVGSNDKFSEYLKRITDFQKFAVEDKIKEYNLYFLPFIFPYPTIYAFIYAKPGYFKYTSDLERDRIRIMNKQI